ncbi:xanthine dehydrogenase family protein subunit M [Curtobacterium sp. MCBD17_040]|uniref:FAD binding domain-containing protein n=1 Tax=Curtobacterium sp. MCBD17_040 TaxID=2175674 RepID=UPI000DA77E5E|nr:xanthine dehydrogenase family protein subunit M [Curtobacterium sp. MCBD17_040]WIB64693.1 xanthine dehydrogenase family protein subunit M [Curtobacterium sp. MCBD17_040]
MKTFEYERATDVDDAVRRLAAEPTAKPLAGGTNLVDLMKLGVERPDRLVDVSHLGLTDVVEEPDGSLTIGAGVLNADLAAHPAVRTRFPVLSRALLAGASGQLRNRATTAGNLLQRTRCVYFNDVSKPCNKREPGTGCPAIEGLSRELAVLGTSHSCIATHPGDMAVALTALDATVHFTTTEGPSSLRIGDFYRLPGDEPERDTNLPVGAVITAVTIPALPFAAHSTYRKARDRRSYAFALASVAAAIDVDGDVVRDVRIAFGAASHKPWRASAAEDALRGGPVTLSAFAAAADAELAAATPTNQNAFKVPLLRRLVVGVLAELTGVDDAAGPTNGRAADTGEAAA